ncbi:hypothetical protein [Actinocorallia libanotica]|uniref:Uncharacterized protein n=1 Tax=Actinocorallia libanotica TaxID=46162 RepID=A0ABN1Q8R8_9ACTN
MERARRRAWGAVLTTGLALWALPGTAAAVCPPPLPPDGWEEAAPSDRREPRESGPDEPPPSPEPRPRHPSGRPVAQVAFELTRGEGHEGVGKGRATVRIDVARGAAERARLAVTGPVRWERFPRSCTARGTRLTCALGDVAGSTELRLGFRERGAGGTDRALQAVVTAPGLPETVETVRLPGPESRAGTEDRSDGAVPGPVKGRTREGASGERTSAKAEARGAAPMGRGTDGSAPVRARSDGAGPVRSRTGDSASVRSGTGVSGPARSGTGDSASARVRKDGSAPVRTGSRKPAAVKARREGLARTAPRRADGSVKPRRPGAPAVPVVPAEPAVPASPAAPAAPAAPAVPRVRTSPSAQAPAVLPAPPKESAVALPPVRPTVPAAPVPRLSIISSEGPLADDGRGWFAVLAVVLAGEMVLLWSLTAVTLWRRRT